MKLDEVVAPSAAARPRPSAPPPEVAREAARAQVETPPATVAAKPVATDGGFSRSGAVLALQAKALAQEPFRGAATAVVNELARQLRCDRVSVGFRRGGRVHVGAMSGTTDIVARQATVRAIGAAMDEAAEQRAIIVYPLPRGSSSALSLAHAELARLAGQTSICSVPIGANGQAVGALVLERREGFDANAVQRARDAALFVAPILELKHRLQAPLGERLLQAWWPRSPHARGFEPRLGHVAAIAAVVAVAALAAWPATFRVVSSARVEGAVQRVIAAPADGFVHTVSARPGEVVRANQVLATLEDQDLALETRKLSAEIAQLDKQYREALTKDDAAQIVIARSKLEQAHTQLELATRQLERAVLKAPIDGVLIGGDLSQSVGMPVKRGQELMTVAPDDGYRVVAEVDEQDVAVLRTGQRARVLFGAFAERPIGFTVTRIAPVAMPLDGRNVFEVEGRLDAGSVASLRPGLRGVARIDVDERNLLAVWWWRAGNWLRRTAWRVLG